MGYRYEYEEVENSALDDVMDDMKDIVSYPVEPLIQCTIYDEDTDEELASGIGHGEDEARCKAERNL